MLKMQVVACVLLVVSAAVAAPYNSVYLRRPRSHGYGSYVAPCAAGGAYHALPSYHPAHPAYGPSYQLNLGPVQGYSQGHYGGYGAPHYRAEDMEDNTGEEPELMSFSDNDPAAAENVPMARYASLGYSGGYEAGGAGAVGVFPGAHPNKCAVPLLLSCSPSIVPGHLVKTHYGSHYAPAYSAAAPIAGAEAYRGADQPQPLEEHPSQPAEHATTVHEAAVAPDSHTQ